MNTKFCIKLFISLLLITFIHSLGYTKSFDSSDFNQSKPLKITRIIPAGNDTPLSKQIVIQFNRPVVPVGKMERSPNEIPIEIFPPLKCQWRWMNTSALACQLNEENKLKPSTKYRLKILPGIKTKDGETISKELIHEFITQRPQVTYSWIQSWKNPSHPSVKLSFNQSVSKSSVEKSISFLHNNNTIGVKAAVYKHDYQNPQFVILPHEKYILHFHDSSKISDDDLKNLEKEEARRIWIVSPEKDLPLDANINLKIKPGLVSALGPEMGVEDRTLVNFDTFPEFNFLGLSCFKNNGEEMLITPQNYQNIGKCNPMRKVSLSFSSPVFSSQIKDHLIITPDLRGGRKDYDPWANQHDYTSLQGSYRKGRTYRVRIPEILKAFQTYNVKSNKPNLSLIEKVKSKFSQSRISDIKDEFGRYLKNPIDLTFFTDHRPPNYELAYQAAILEKQIDSDIPLYLTNIDQVTFEYQALTSDGLKKDKIQTYEQFLSKEKDIQYAIPMQIRELLDHKSGVIFGNITTTPMASNKSFYDSILFTSVTPYQVHAKIGHFNSLIWVTDLATGEPIKNAKVQIYKGMSTDFTPNTKKIDEGVTDQFGLTSLKGAVDLDPDLKLLNWCYITDHCEMLFVRIDHGDDIALLPLSHSFEIDVFRSSGYSIWPHMKRKYGYIHTWGTTAQGVYRLGDKIQYKLYVREQNNETFIPAPKEKYSLEIIDPLGKTVEKIENIQLSDFGSFHGEYEIPKNTAVGWYQFRLKSNFTKNYTWYPLEVLVSDFTPSPFKVINNINGDFFKNGDKVKVQTKTELHSGGAFTDAETRITAYLKAKSFHSTHPISKQFHFDTSGKVQHKDIFNKVDRIGDTGEIDHEFKIETDEIFYGKLNIESAVRDDRGKYISTYSTADFSAIDRLVGLKKTKWVHKEKEPAIIKYIVVDEKGIPVKGTKVDINIEREDVKISKVKGAGNTYTNNYIRKWISTATCSGKPNKSALNCEFIPERSGIYRVVANIKDTQNRVHSSTEHLWITGQGSFVWESKDDHSLEIIPEKNNYQIGDKAKYLIKNPYPGAKALITMERYGILKSWTQTLETNTPILEFDIEKDFMPGFYLSVTVFSPRVDNPPSKNGEIDLGKPSFKTGYLKVPVVDPYKQIDVTIKTNQEFYKPRDQVKATIHAELKHKDKKENMEIAVAVIDEAVLDLILTGKKHFDPYEGFYKLSPLDLKNYSLLTKLIGRQNFEKKGANPGGDGGSTISIRSLFKYVSYWNPSIKPDENGNANISFKVPDNLTGWRIFAFAVTPSDRMGLGDVNFKVNRPTEIRPIMPNQITENDKFQAGFSVNNRTDQLRKIKVAISASGDLKEESNCKLSNKKTVCEFSKIISLKPYKRETVFMPILSNTLKQERNKEDGTIHFNVTASDNIDGDGIIHKLPVYKRRSLETASTYGTTTASTISESLKVPDKIYPDVGEISVNLSPSIIGNIDGAFRYIQTYPYSCWEQKLAKAIMSSHYQNLKSYLPDDLDWPESESLPQNLLNQAASYQAPNGGMAYFRAEDQFVSPYLSVYTALAFNWLRESKYKIPQEVEIKLHNYLELLLRNDVMPTFFDKGMSSTVRAVALSALAKNGKINKWDLDRFKDHIQYMSLFGKSHFLQAALEVKNADDIVDEVTQMILSHSSQTGGKFAFNEILDDSFSRILATPLRTNCSILSSFIKYSKSKDDTSLIGDIPFKLVRMITQGRGNRTHWENTQENIFCMNGLIDYAKTYESTKPDMNISVSIKNNKIGKTSFNDVKNPQVTFHKPLQEKDINTNQKINISKNGDGRFYYTTRLSYASLDENAERINAGIDIRKEYSVERNKKWILLKDPNEIKRGELVRVDIFVSLPTARHFVVIHDPIPGGLEPVNRDLATTSLVDANKGNFQAIGGSWWFKFNDWHYYNESRWSFYHQELKLDSARFYSDYLSPGNYHLSYTAQAIAEGEFSKMPVHAEEMYDPDVFGKGLPGILNIKD